MRATNCAGRRETRRRICVINFVRENSRENHSFRTRGQQWSVVVTRCQFIAHICPVQRRERAPTVNIGNYAVMHAIRTTEQTVELGTAAEPAFPLRVVTCQAHFGLRQ